MDGTEKQGDTPQTTGQSSPGEQGTSQAKTYTEEEVNKKLSDALAKAGRDTKSLELKRQSLTEREDRIKGAEAKIEAAELEKLKDNPEALDLHKAKKAIREERAALERDKAEHAEMVRAAQKTQMEIELWEIATGEKIDPVLLKDTMEDLNLSTVEQAKLLAKRLGGKKEVSPFNPITGVTSGHKDSTEGKSARQLFAEAFRERKKN